MPDSPFSKPISYLSLKNLGRWEETPLIIINSKNWWTSWDMLASIISDNSEALSSSQKIIKIFDFVVENSEHATPPLDQPLPEIYENPAYFFNAWGYGYCSDRSIVFAQFAIMAGYKSRIVPLNKHTVAEVFYDDAWHMFDTDRQVYYSNTKNQIASAEEIIKNKKILDKPLNIKSKANLAAIQKNAFSVSLPLRTIKSDVYFQDTSYKFFYTLKTGEEIRFYYNWQNKYVNEKELEKSNSFSNGLLFSPKNTNIKSEININLPYPIVASYIAGQNICNQKNNISFSLDKNNWQTIENANCVNNMLDLSDYLPNNGSLSTFHYSIKFEKPALKLTNTVITQFQFSKFSLPEITANKVDFSFKYPIKNSVVLNIGF